MILWKKQYAALFCVTYEEQVSFTQQAWHLVAAHPSTLVRRTVHIIWNSLSLIAEKWVHNFGNHSGIPGWLRSTLEEDAVHNGNWPNIQNGIQLWNTHRIQNLNQKRKEVALIHNIFETVICYGHMTICCLTSTSYLNKIKVS